MAKSSKEQELAIKIAGKVENSFKQSLGVTEDGLNKIASTAKKAAAVAAAAFAALKIGEFIGDAISEYSEFEQSMANTSAIAGATSEEYERLAEAARAAGKATTFTASEAADALGYMALAGWDVETSTKALTPVLKLAEATQADLATTSDQVTDSMSAMGVGIDELQNYLDVIVMTNNKANTTASDLMDAFIGCGGAARSAGMDYTETATALGILANNGIKGSEAGTALNSMLVRISTKDVAQKAFKELGVAIYDSSGEMRNMQDILVDLNGAMAGMTQEQKNAYMSAIAGTNYYSQFGYLLDGVKEGVDGSASAWDSLSESLANSEGALDQMDATVTNTLQGSIARFQSAISDLKISLVEDFGPYAITIIDEVAEAVPKITENFSAMIQNLPIGSFMDGVGNMAGAFLDFLAGVTGGKGAVETLSDVMESRFGVTMPQSVQNAIGVVADFWEKAKGVASFLAGTAANTISNIKDKIAENQPAIDNVIQLASDLKDRLFEAFDKAKPAITFISETALPAIVDGLLTVVGGAADVLDKFTQWDGFLPTVTGIATAIAGFKLVKTATEIAKVTKAMTLLRIAKIKDKAETLYLNALYAKDAIVKAASTAATWAQTAATTAWNVVCGAATAVTTALGAAFTFLTGPIGLVILAIGAVIAIGVLLYKNWDLVKEKAAQLGEWVSGKFQALKEAVCNAIDGFKDKFPVAFEFISGVFQGFWTTVQGVIDGVKQVFQGIIDFIAGVFTGDWSRALEGLKSIFSGAFNALKSLALAPLNALKGVVTGAFNAIDTATGGKLTAIKEKASECWNNVKQTAGTVLQAAKDTVSEKLNNMKSAYEQHGGGIKGVAAAAIEGVKGYYTAGYTFIDNLTGGKLSAIKEKFSTKMGEVKASVSEAFGNVRDTASNLMETARANVSAKLDAMKSAYTNAGGGIKGIVAGAMAGVKSTFSSVMSTVDSLTGGKLSSISSAFTSKLSAAKSAASSALGSIKQAFSDKMESARSVVTGALAKIKGAFNFHWSLPHLNLPHISVSGGVAPFGIGGKGSLPKFSIQWYKEGGIMTHPTAFGIDPSTGSLMAGGEAGAEAIVPLSQLWEKMRSIIKGILDGNQNGQTGNALAALTEKISAMAQGASQTPIGSLAGNLMGNVTNDPQPVPAGGPPITYAPVYNFNAGAPSKEDMVEAEKMSQEEFNQMMAQWQKDNDRKRF